MNPIKTVAHFYYEEAPYREHETIEIPHGNIPYPGEVAHLKDGSEGVVKRRWFQYHDNNTHEVHVLMKRLVSAH